MSAQIWLRYATRRLLRENALATLRADRLGRDERAPRDQHLAVQEANLRASVQRAAKVLPAYQALANRIPDRGLVDFLRQELPIIDKRSLIEQREAFYPRGGRAYPWWNIGKTSGTSGTPLEVFRDLNAACWEHAFQVQHWRWSGWRPGDAQAVLRGDIVVPTDRSAPPFWHYQTWGRELVLSTRHLRRDTAALMADQFVRHDVKQLRAYPSAASELARLNQELGLGLRLRSVFTSSEMLYPEQRTLIESSFQCRVFDLYGMAERVAYAMQCPAGRHHVHPAYSYVEIVDADGRPTTGEGHVVGTTFHNSAMPLLRYKVDDLAQWSTSSCTCGCSYPTFETLSGRVADRLFDLDGVAITPGVITFAFKGVAHIDRAQVAQVARDLWVVRLVPRAEFGGAQREHLLANFSSLVSSRLNLQIEMADAIPNLPSGKYKWVVQEWRA